MITQSHGHTTAADADSLEPWRRNLQRDDLDLSDGPPAAWWTGRRPAPLTAARLQPDLSRCSRADVQAYFDEGWTLTEALFSSLRSLEAFYRPPSHGLRHPLIFYYAHPAALYVNKLRVARLIDAPIHPLFEEVFETGVDEMSWDDLSKNEMEWPTVREAHAYRAQVYRSVSDLIAGHSDLADGHPPITPQSALWALFLAFEHERIHLETSSVLIRELPLTLLRTPVGWPDPHPSAAERRQPAANGWRAVPAGRVRIGKPETIPTFGWDNEYGHREADVPGFEVTRQLISNAEFLTFVRTGGYREARYWSPDGWAWRNYRNAKWPAFWVPDGPAGLHEYQLRTLFDTVPLPLHWPAIVNFHEAQAYAKWRSDEDGLCCRLITEAEHHVLRTLPAGDPASVNWRLRHGSESPVDADETSDIRDLFGNVWQWCADHFHPLPGFRVHPYYEDFSSPCFDGKHQMILGGSFVSTGDEATPYARFHFRPHFFQHAGFRLVRAADDSDGAVVHLGNTQDSANPYESESMLGEYLTLHFGSPDIQMPCSEGPREATGFPQRCAALVEEWCGRLRIFPQRALDVGCGPGGASFALAETFEEVLGVDLSARFIDAAQRLRQHGTIEYQVREHGDEFRAAAAAASDRSREHVRFRQADACSLPAELAHFDAVLLANLLCRVPSPRAVLSRLAGERGLVRPGGLLVLTTPFTWMERFTPKDAWLGHSADALAAELGPRFQLLEARDMPLVIREHARKFQYIVSLATVWQRVS